MKYRIKIKEYADGRKEYVCQWNLIWWIYFDMSSGKIGNGDPAIYSDIESAKKFIDSHIAIFNEQERDYDKAEELAKQERKRNKIKSVSFLKYP